MEALRRQLAASRHTVSVQVGDTGTNGCLECDAAWSLAGKWDPAVLATGSRHDTRIPCVRPRIPPQILEPIGQGSFARVYKGARVFLMSCASVHGGLRRTLSAMQAAA